MFVKSFSFSLASEAS
uniref:Uncharacterized protein n=1 Tax=Anguilla anguilla TaxID=7936 RepID=A0A0E9UQL8_ANGAN